MPHVPHDRLLSTHTYTHTHNYYPNVLNHVFLSIRAQSRPLTLSRLKNLRPKPQTPHPVGFRKRQPRVITYAARNVRDWRPGLFFSFLFLFLLSCFSFLLTFSLSYLLTFFSLLSFALFTQKQELHDQGLLGNARESLAWCMVKGCAPSHLLAGETDGSRLGGGVSCLFYLFIDLSIYLFIYLSIYLFIYLSGLSRESLMGLNA